MAAAEQAGNPPCVIIAGPTASGKSALALGLAGALGGTIINADAMQSYRDLRILTARPTAAEEQEVPHLLYGYRAAADLGTVASWRVDALAAAAAATRGGRVPILCGGTGMYLTAFTAGLAEIPDPGPGARAEARSLLADMGPAALHARLAARDPDTAARLRPSDGQRIARAWEILAGTGTGLTVWQARPALPPAPYGMFAILLDPPRPALRAAIETRFETMLAQGAVEEVRALLGQGLDPALPLMRAHGVPELAGCVRGDISLVEAARRAITETAAYTKRQATWFRHHNLAPSTYVRTINALIGGNQQYMEHILPDLRNFLQRPVDASQHGA